MRIRYLLFLLMIGVVFPAWSLDYLAKIDLDATYVSEKEGIEGRYKLWTLLIDCQFQEGCLLKQLEPLDALYKRTQNRMFLSFKDFLQHHEPRLQKYAAHCNIEAKRVVKKVYAQCLQEKMDQEKKRREEKRQSEARFLLQDINEIKDAYVTCLTTHMEPLAQENNLFAQAAMVSLGMASADVWYERMQRQAGTPAYLTYLNCSSLP